MITKRQLLSLACAGGLASIVRSGARAQLARATSHMMVGFGAGGAIDAIARMLVEEMRGYSSSFIVENRPGAGGRLVLGALKNGPADGSAMVLTPASMLVVFPHVYKALGYDALNDFVPVTSLLVSVPDHSRPCGAGQRHDARRFREMVRGQSEAGDLWHRRRGIDAALLRYNPGQGRRI